MRRLLLMIRMALAIAPFSAQAQKNIATLAGGGPNNLAPLKSSIGIPVGVGLIPRETFMSWILDANRVYVVTATTGSASVFAGTGGQGVSGQTGVATAARYLFDGPLH